MASHAALQAAGVFVCPLRHVQRRVAIHTPAVTPDVTLPHHQSRCIRMVVAAAGDDTTTTTAAVAEPISAAVPSATTVPETAAGDASSSSNAGRSDGGRGRSSAGRGAGRGGRGVGGRGRRRPEPTVGLEQIVPDAEFDGVVTSVQTYGAFVNFGAEVDGLVHISQLAEKFVDRVADTVKLNQEVHVRVVSMEDRKISLTMKPKAEAATGSNGNASRDNARPRLGKVASRGGSSSAGKAAGNRGGGGSRTARPEPKVKPGQMVTGTVQRTTPYGAFLDLADGTSALLHLNCMANPQGLDSPQPRQLVKDGEELQVRVLKVKDGKIDVSQQSEEEAQMDAALAKGIGSEAASSDASPFGFMLARAGVRSNAFHSDEKAPDAASNGTTSAATSSPAVGEQAESHATPTAAASAGEETAASPLAASERQADSYAIPSAASSASETTAPPLASEEQADTNAISKPDVLASKDATSPSAADQLGGTTGDSNTVSAADSPANKDTALPSNLQKADDTTANSTAAPSPNDNTAPSSGSTTQGGPDATPAAHLSASEDVAAPAAPHQQGGGLNAIPTADLPEKESANEAAGSAALAGVTAPAIAETVAAQQTSAPSAAGSSEPKEAGTQSAPEGQLAAAGESAGAAAEAGVAIDGKDGTKPPSGPAPSSSKSVSVAGSGNSDAQTSQLRAAGETPGAAAEAGVPASAETQESSGSSSAEAPAKAKSDGAQLPDGVSSAQATSSAEQLSDDAPPTEQQLAAAGETPAAADLGHDATPSDSAAHEKATGGATHLQAVAAGEELDKDAQVPSSEPAVASEPAVSAVSSASARSPVSPEPSLSSEPDVSSEPAVTSEPASSPEEARQKGLALQEPELAAAAAPDSGTSAGEGAEPDATGGQPRGVEELPALESSPVAAPGEGAAAGEGASSLEEGKPGDVTKSGASAPSAGGGAAVTPEQAPSPEEVNQLGSGSQETSNAAAAAPSSSSTSDIAAGTSGTSDAVPQPAAQTQATTSDAKDSSAPALSSDARQSGQTPKVPESPAAAAPKSSLSAADDVKPSKTNQARDAVTATTPQETVAAAGQGASSGAAPTARQEDKPSDVSGAGTSSTSATGAGLTGAVDPVAQTVASAAPEPIATLAGAAAGTAASNAAPAPPQAEAPKAVTSQAEAPKPEASGASATAPAAIPAKVVKELRDKTGAGMMDCKKALLESQGDFDKASEALRAKGLAQVGKKASRIATEGLVATYIHAGAKLGVLVEVNCETDFVARGPEFKELVADIAMQAAASQEATYVSTADVPQSFLEAERAVEMQKEDILKKPEQVRGKIVDGRVAKTVSRGALLEQPFIRDTNILVSDVVNNAIAKLGENIRIRRFERYVLGEGIEKKQVDLAKEVEEQKAAVAAEVSSDAASAAASPAADVATAADDKPKVQIAASQVKELRQQSGAGMMDCKKALLETQGDITAAAEILRKKGLASAGKKAGRIASEGRIGSYIHTGSRLGALIELNCETDFVSRGDTFGELLSDLAMQVVSSPDVTVVSVDDVDKDMLEEERRIQMQKEDLLSKPENIREKMIEGRLSKFAKDAALLEQPFIKDNSITVGDAIAKAIAGTGENIKIRRFTSYSLGEGLEKKNEDFAAEVAAQMGGQ